MDSCLREKTVDVGSTPGILELQGAPENALFRRLDNCKERDVLQVEPGNLLIAVYGDNWFQQVCQACRASTLISRGVEASVATAVFVLQVRYTLQVLYPVSVPEAVHKCDKQLLAKRDELRAFERTFTAAQVCFYLR